MKTPFKKAAKLIFLFAWIGSLFSLSDVYSQEIPESQVGRGISGNLSPQGGNTNLSGINVNPYRGSIGINIPLYDYSDNAFNLPISLYYYNTGLKPNSNTEILGLGWKLNAGGIITREIKGIHDEYFQTNVPSPLRGFRRLPPDYQDLEYDYRYTGNEGEEYMKVYKDKKSSPTVYYETTPDIFTFSFLGHTGSFIIMPGESIKVFNSNHPAGEYKVECLGDDIAGFKITTGDGYCYEFGSSYCEKVKIYEQNSTEVNISYLLKKIISPEKEEIIFYYEDGGYSFTCIPRSYLEDIHYHALCKETNGNLSTIRVYKNETNSSPTIDYFLLRKSIKNIKSILIKNRLRIDFSYTDKPREVWSTNEQHSSGANISSYYLSSGYHLKSLSRITVSGPLDGNDHLLKEIEFSYRQTGQTSNVCLLKSVNIMGEGAYSFSYHSETATFPPINTYSVDWWGYYNGKPNNKNYFYPSANNLQYRAPDSTKSIIGMLTRIQYPTGGKVCFEYEGNSSGTEVFYALNGNSFGFNTKTKHSQQGGVRVCKIEEYADKNSNTPSRSRSFIYSEGNICSGVAFEVNIPQSHDYSIKKSTENNEIIYIKRKKTTTEDISPYSPHKNAIEYSTVYEILKDGSQIKYSYHTNYDHRDIRDHYRIMSNPDFTSGGSRAYYVTPYSQAGIRGKLASKEFLDSDGESVYRESYNYLRDTCSYIEVPEFYAGVSYLSRWNLETIYLQGTTRTWLEHGNPAMTINMNCVYNALGQVKKVSTEDGQGRIINNYIYYVSDLSDVSLTEAEKEMKNKNILSAPIQTISTIIENPYILIFGKAEEKVTAARENTFKKITYNSNTIIRLGEQKKGLIFPGTRLDNLEYDSNGITFMYDTKGNIIESTDSNNVKTSYVWGYGGLYIVAIIRNTDFNTVKDKLGIETLAINPLTGCLDEYQREDLKSIPYADVITYKYKPFVGVIEVIDQFDIKTSYEYNSHGKLSRIRDNNGYILSEFQYSTDL